MRSIQVILFVATCLIAATYDVRGQTALPPKPVPAERYAATAVNVSGALLWELRDAWAAADVKRQRLAAAQLVDAINRTKICCLVFEPLRIVFLAQDLAGTPVIGQVLLSSPRDRIRLDGRHGPDRPVYDLFVAEDPVAVVASQWTSVAALDPIVGAAQTFLTAALAKQQLPSSIATTQFEVAAAPLVVPSRAPKPVPQPPHQLWVAATKYTLPDPRATLTMVDQIYAPQSLDRLGSFAGMIAWQNRSNGCVQGFIGEFFSQMKDACDQMPGPGCIAGLIGSKFDQSIVFKALPTDACRQNATVLAVADRLYQLTKMIDASVSATATVQSVPLSHVGFGFMTGFLASPKVVNTGRERVKIDSGKFSPDSPARLLTVGYVNWVWKGYRPEDPPWRPAAAVQVGAALQPNFGPAIGGALMLGSTLGINAGVVYLASDTVDVSRVGQPDPVAKSVELKLGWTRAFYVGLSYNFVGK